MLKYLKKEILILIIKKNLIYQMSLSCLNNLFQIKAIYIKQTMNIIKNLQLYLENLEVFQTKVKIIKLMTLLKLLYFE